MGRCTICEHAKWEGFAGYEGHWICMHPYRSELDNRGHWTYPKIDSPNITICKTPKHSKMIDDAEALSKAKTPRWCYYEAVERAKVEEPSFDPDYQRKILYDDD